MNTSRAAIVLLCIIGTRPDSGAAQSRSSTPPRTITYPAATSRTSGLDLDARGKSLTIDEEAGCEFNRVSDLVLQKDGGLVVANSGNHELCFFSPAGKLIRRVGRSGAGPGEYRSMRSLRPLRGDSLLVYDDLLRRLSILTGDGTYVRSISLNPSPDTLGSVTTVETLADGSVLVGYSEIKRAAPRPEATHFAMQLFRYDSNGKVIGRLGGFLESEHFIQAVPWQMGRVAYWSLAFGRRLSMTAFGDGFLAGDGTEFSVAEHSANGSVRVTHRVDQPLRAVTAADIAAYKKRVLAAAKPERRTVEEKMVTEMPYPRTYPAYQRVLADPAGRVWLELYPAPEAVTTNWLVLEPASQRSSLVAVPARFRPMAVSRSMLCGVARDELDLESIRCLTLRAR